MPMIQIRQATIDVDIRAELEQFNWHKPRWPGDKLLAASPFRHDNTPSFFVRLEPYGKWPAGVWSDQGAYDAEWASGNFVKLLAFLRNETIAEAEDYLLATYAATYSDEQTVTLGPLNLRVQRNRQSLNNAVLADYSPGPCAYLAGRGISDEVQRQAGVLYDAGQQAVVMPWRLADGRLANVKFRKTYGKIFWYAADGWPIRELIYGLDSIKGPTAVYSEAEIDALSWRTAGYEAIAGGGAEFTAAKRDMIIRSPIEQLLIATDNDKAGEKLRREVERQLSGHVALRHVRVDAQWKDANEALMAGGVEALRRAVGEAKAVGQQFRL